MEELARALPAELAFTLAGAAFLWVGQMTVRAARRRYAAWRIDHRTRRANPVFDQSAFAFGGWEESVFVADMHLGGYAAADIETSFLGAFRVDESIASEVSTRAMAWQAKADRGEIYNGEVIGVQEPVITRRGTNERPGLRLGFHTTDYVTQRAVADVFMGLPAVRRLEVVRAAASAPDPRFSVTFGVSLAVVTADDKLLFAKRSQRAAVNQGAFTCGVAEGMAPLDVTAGAPDPFATALRGLHEEFGVALGLADSKHLRLLGLFLNLDYWEWGMFGVLDFRKLPEQRLTSDTILRYTKAARPKDRWEHESVQFVDFAPGAVADFMVQNQVTNYGVVTAIAALLSDPAIDWDDTEAAFSKRARRRPDPT